MQEQRVIFSRVFDLVAWLAPKVESFPKVYRHTVAARLLDAALNVAEQLYRAQATSGRNRQRALTEADCALDHLRFYLRLAHHWQWLSHGQYEHVSRLVAEIGRLLGGWMKAK